MPSVFEEAVTKFGYLAILFGSSVQGEVFGVLGGMFAHRGYLSIYPAVGCAAVGAFAGDLFYFLMGRKYGRALFESHARMAARVPQLERLMTRYHTAWFFAVRYVWGLRWASAALAGSMRMSMGRYSLVDLSACIVWAWVMGLLGYLAGITLERLLGDIERYEMFFLGAIVVVTILVVAGRRIAGMRTNR